MVRVRKVRKITTALPDAPPPPPPPPARKSFAELRVGDRIVYDGNHRDVVSVNENPTRSGMVGVWLKKLSPPYTVTPTFEHPERMVYMVTHADT